MVKINISYFISGKYKQHYISLVNIKNNNDKIITCTSLNISSAIPFKLYFSTLIHVLFSIIQVMILINEIPDFKFKKIKMI